METYYAYVHAKPTNEGANSIFYAGKGTLRRAHLLKRCTRNNHYTNTVNKCGIENVLIGKIECSSEDIAFELERGIIKRLRGMGVKLANLTDGGEGSSGYRLTDSAKSKISKSASSRWNDEDYRKRTIASQTVAQRTAKITEKKLAAALSNAEKARAVLSDPEVKKSSARKNSVKSLEMWADPEFKAATIEAMKAHWTDDVRAAKGAEVLGRKRVTNGVDERNVKPEEVAGYIAQGWSVGRKSRVPNKHARSDKQRKD